MPGTFLDPEDTAINKTNMVPLLTLIEEYTGKKQISNRTSYICAWIDMNWTINTIKKNEAE